MSEGRTRLRRGAIVIAATAALWTAAIVLTGGLSVRAGALLVSSRNPRNPFLLACLSLGSAWMLAPAGRRGATIAADVRPFAVWLREQALRAWRSWTPIEGRLLTRTSSRVPAAFALVAAIGVVTIGFTEGALVAASSDAWGYVSQADRWARGALRVEQPLMRELTPEIPAEALAPLAYRPAADRTTIVPVVSPGLPMLMGLFQVAAGRDAVFAVVPLMAGFAIGATYLLGSRLGGPWSGAIAAILLAASPSFLFQLTSSPMSDIPAAAWWALSLALVLAPGRWTALAGGAAAGAAILTRSNLAPLAAVPALLLLTAGWQETAMRRAGLFVAGVLPAFGIVAWLNNYWYGSPLNSGYGSLGELYQAANVIPNLERYPVWLVESQTPLVLLGFAAPWVLRRRADAVMLMVFAAGMLLAYLPYIPFDAWWFVRFLLPAYPALLALSAATLLHIARRLPSGLRVAVPAAVVALTVWHCVGYAAARATFHTEGEWKYAVAGRYVAEHVPERAVLLAFMHSGSARYYSGRVTIRWDWIPPDKLEWTLAEVRRLGYTPYALIEDWEEPALRQRFAGRPALAAFDRPPIVELPLGNVRLYELDPR